MRVTSDAKLKRATALRSGGKSWLELSRPDGRRSVNLATFGASARDGSAATEGK